MGRLLIRELLAAADRGVRVRLLIDDMYGGEADDVWSALDAHPAVEVRLFNPFKRGYSKNLQFLTRMTTVNHRMHSKTFTVDNQVSIVGGRNIGDEYFDADPDLAFSDLDVMAIGPAWRRCPKSSISTGTASMPARWPRCGLPRPPAPWTGCATIWPSSSCSNGRRPMWGRSENSRAGRILGGQERRVRLRAGQGH